MRPPSLRGPRRGPQVFAGLDAAFAEHVELGLSERRSDLVLHDLGPHSDTDDVVSVFDLRDAAHVDTARTVELECPAAGRRFGAAEHDADLFANLVDEDHDRL